MLAESIALGVVTLAVIGSGSYLLQVAWRRGGVARKVAIAILLAMLCLVAWLFIGGTRDGDATERISQFVGAWGILFIIVGLVASVATLYGRFRISRRKDPEK